jgi:hypothetical protein
MVEVLHRPTTGVAVTADNTANATVASKKKHAKLEMPWKNTSIH